MAWLDSIVGYTNADLTVGCLVACLGRYSMNLRKWLKMIHGFQGFYIPEFVDAILEQPQTGGAYSKDLVGVDGQHHALRPPDWASPPFGVRAERLRAPLPWHSCRHRPASVVCLHRGASAIGSIRSAAGDCVLHREQHRQAISDDIEVRKELTRSRKKTSDRRRIGVT